MGKWPWRVLPELHKSVRFLEGGGKLARWQRVNTHHSWDGMTFCDSYCLLFPEVKEALRRLQINDPREYDARQERLMRASNLFSQKKVLPKEKWTKYEEDPWYLENYLAEIEDEKVERGAAAGVPFKWTYLGKWV